DTDDEDEEPFEDEDDDEEEEEHLAPADSPSIPIVYPIPSAGDTEAFKTDEAAPTPVPSPRWHTARISIRPEEPMPFLLEEEVERFLALPSPSTHHPLYPSPPLPPPPSSLHLPPQVPISLPLLSSPLPSSLFIPPLADRREDIPEAELPPHKTLCLTALTPSGGHRADYGFIGTIDAKIRRQRAEEVGYGIRDV
ncbi:hypothetical protein Tco_0198629, partial [Tanacetum coccineum]